MTARFFHPWKGNEYEAGFRIGAKVLLVGDSHYGGDPRTSLTVEVVKSLAIVEPIPFFETLRVLTSGTEKALPSKEFWQRVSFCNLVQECLPRSNAVPSEVQLQTGWRALAVTIEELQPDIMFVFSRRAWSFGWDHLPNEPAIGSGAVREDAPDLWRYERRNLPPLIAAGFNHPSRLLAPRFVWQTWADFCWSMYQVERRLVPATN